jgi:hypothetical protein
MPRDTQTLAADRPSGDLDAGIDQSPVDPQAKNAAALAAVERDDPSPKARWEGLLGRYLGDKLYDVVKREASAEDFMRMGDDALKSAIRSLAKQITATANKGSPLDKINASMWSKEIQDQLAPLAHQFMTTGPGAKLASAIADFVEGSPLAVISAMLLAAAVAVAADMTIPELRSRFGLGHGFSIDVDASLGSLRNLTVNQIGAAIEYQSKSWQLKVGYDHLRGDKAQGAFNGVRPFLTKSSGQIPPEALDRLNADVAFKINAMQDGKLHFTDENLFAHGRLLSGNIGTRLDGKVNDFLTVSAGANQHYGDTKGATASLNATYAPNPDESFSLGVTQGLGGANSSTAITFSMQIKDRMRLEGHYDHKDGAWVGMIVHF